MEWIGAGGEEKSLRPDLALENVTLYSSFRMPIHLLFQMFLDRKGYVEIIHKEQ